MPTLTYTTSTLKKPCGEINIQKESFDPTQQDCRESRRVPLHLLERVEQELEKLIEDKQIIRLQICSDEHFISPVLITFKKRRKHQNCLRLKRT